MTTSADKAKSIFLSAVELASAEERRAFLAAQCGDDNDLRRDVDELLKHHAEIAGFLETPADRPEPTTAEPPSAERPGATIGPYKLLQQIGEGGMGAVFMAEQSHPVQRKVAVKVIKAGMDTRQVIARFEAERQALAMMDHVNIARILDVGATETGRPFFVMELVHGVPITKYCDDNHLTPRERLELFVPVCHAIQHAHQKGIIHRDIKPSNVMVTLYDGKPVPKIIDFGVAKAIEQKLTQRTLFTQYGMMVGTFEYMSPEQAEMSALGVDTRSDIYSLGVLLYELLTGSTPLTHRRIRNAAYDEIVRMIREEEPATPSARLSASGEALASISAQRHMEPGKLTKLVRGELDWIVMKCLEKDRNRRYETANGFAMDVQRYLANEPVLAGAPSAIYRMRKFVRRNQGQAIAASLVLLALVAGIVASTWQAVRATRAEAAAVAALEEKEQARAAEAQQRQRAETERTKAEQAEAATLADYRASTDDTIEQLIGSKPELGPKERTYLENAVKRWQALANRQGDDERNRAIRAEGHLRVGSLWQRLGRKEEARAEYMAARDLWKKLADQFPTVPDSQRGLASTRHNLGLLLVDLGQREEARVEFLAARDLWKKLVERFPKVPDYQAELARTHNNLGIRLAGLGPREEARAEYLTACDLQKKLVEQFPSVPQYQRELANIHHNLGALLAGLGQREEARGEYITARDLQKKLVERFPTVPDYQGDLARTHNHLGILLAGLRPREEARGEYLAARDLQKKLVEQFPSVPQYQRELAITHNNLGTLLTGLGQREEARGEYLAARDLQKKLVEQYPAVPDYQYELAGAHNNLASLLAGLRRHAEARGEYLAARDLQKKLVEQFPEVPVYQRVLAGTHGNLGNLLCNLGQHVEARGEYSAARDLQRKLVEQFPEVPEYRSSLANTHNNLGLLLADLGQHGEARTEYLAACDLRKKLVEQFPEVLQYQIGLGGSFCNIGHLNSEPADSLEWYDRAIRTLQPVHEKEPRDATAILFLRNCHWNRALAYDRLQRFGEAVRDWTRTIELSLPAEQPRFRMRRAMSQLQAGMVAKAVAEVAELTKSSNWSAEEWHDFACVYAIAGKTSGLDAPVRQEYADRAMKLLHKSVEAGYKNVAHMKKDADLDSLREREDFQKLLAEMEAAAKPPATP